MWFAIVATAATFAIFVVLGNFVTYGAQSSGSVAVHDVISPGEHDLNGIIVLPLSCDELSVETQELSSTAYQLVFSTWQDPSVTCPQTPTPRTFETVVFAPSVGVSFSASLDGAPLPITIVSDVATSSQP